MDYQEAIEEAETQIDMYESMILYNKDFETKNDNSNYERKVDFLKNAISAMQELEKYKKLGTLEEVREVVERQKEKQVINIGKGDILRFGTCPICNRRISTVEGGNYCQNCGQKLDWSEVEE